MHGRQLIRLQTFMFKKIVGVGMSPRINSAIRRVILRNVITMVVIVIVFKKTYTQ